ncbi:MAG TPA: metallophosphoesterase family protein [Longimicrobiales bacterium]|nr:metallophosphoesterase family protein [Longimicrobiales bacterium]
MPLAALYDIHGNLPALEAVLADLRAVGVDDVVVGGDVVPGPMPAECLALLRALDLPALFVRGNGDRSILETLTGGEPAYVPPAFREVVQWTADQVTPDDARWMASWPTAVTVHMDPFGPVHFCHATPRNDTELFTRLTDEKRLLPVFAGVGAPLVVCGHTHMQFDRRVGDTRVVNAGSVGMPFGEAGAYWLLLHRDGVELRRTAYDGAAAAQRVRATAYPQADAFASGSILSPPAEDVMLEAFTRSELA